MNTKFIEIGSIEEEFQKNFPVQIHFTIPWGDLDLYQVVNNVHYFRYFQDARVAYCERIGKVFTKLTEMKIGLVVKNQTCHYLRPLTFPDQVTCGVRIGSLTAYGMIFEYELFKKEEEKERWKLSATGNTELVFFDFTAKRKIKMPDFFSTALSTLTTSPREISV